MMIINWGASTGGGGGSPFDEDIVVDDTTDQLIIGNGQGPSPSGFSINGNNGVFFGTAPNCAAGTAQETDWVVIGQWAMESGFGPDAVHDFAVAIGYAAGLSYGNINDSNFYGDIFIGAEAGKGDGVTGPSGIFIGAAAGGTGTGGSNNAGIGIDALKAVAEGSYNNFMFGSGAGQNITTGINNIGVGSGALRTNVTGSRNIAIGTGTLFVATAGSNTVVGTEAGAAITLATDDVLMGDRAGQGLTIGSNNVYLGSQAGISAVDGSNNVVIGYTADIGASTNQAVIIGGNAVGDSDQIVIGHSANGGNAAYGIVIGRDAGLSMTNQPGNILVGRLTDTISQGVILIGNSATTTGDSDGAIVIGNADMFATGGGVLVNNNGIAIGHGITYSDGLFGVCIGSNAVLNTAQSAVVVGDTSNVAADYGVAIGHGAYVRAGDTNSVAIGNAAGFSGANGIEGISIGVNAQANGDYSVAIGSQAQGPGAGANGCTVIGSNRTVAFADGLSIGSATYEYILCDANAANADLQLKPRGTGVVQFGTYTAGVVAQGGTVAFRDAAGNLRQMLCA